tara:strand:- start:810 stop:1022 length:213 start_codon:yes stop_codon:yes gene_type:complete
MDNNDITRILTRHDERLKNIYSSLGRIEKHLERLNGKVGRHETDIAKIHTWGAFAIFTFPVLINVIMRFL